MTPEGKVKEQVKRILKNHAAFYFMPSAGVYGRGGASDFICCVRGLFVAVECKASKADKPTKLQQLFMDQVEAAIGAAFVVHAGNLADFEEWINGIG